MRHTLAPLALALALAWSGIAVAQPAPPAPPPPPAAPADSMPAPPSGVEWRRYARASEVQLRGLAAIIYISPESRPDVEVAVAHRGGVPGIELSNHGRRLVVDGRLERDMGGCRVGPAGAFEAQVGDSWRGAEALPAIYLRVPLEAVVSVSGAVQVRMGRAQSLRLTLNGCSETEVEGVDGAADISINGDGLRARVFDVGAAAVRIAGQGDVLLGVVRESLALSIAGEGRFEAVHADGPTTIAIAGDGRATIREGRAQPMSVTILGDGVVAHYGEADRLDVALFGDGDVRVAQVQGPVRRRVFGDGVVEIGGF